MKFIVFGRGLFNAQNDTPINIKISVTKLRNAEIIPSVMNNNKILATNPISNICVEDLVKIASFKVILI